MTEKQTETRKASSPLSLRRLVPAGWHEERPAFAGDPFFDWESAPERPHSPREFNFGSPKPDRKSKA